MDILLALFDELETVVVDYLFYMSQSRMSIVAILQYILEVQPLVP